MLLYICELFSVCAGLLLSGLLEALQQELLVVLPECCKIFVSCSLCVQVCYYLEALQQDLLVALQQCCKIFVSCSLQCCGAGAAWSRYF